MEMRESILSWLEGFSVESRLRVRLRRYSRMFALGLEASSRIPSLFSSTESRLAVHAMMYPLRVTDSVATESFGGEGSVVSVSLTVTLWAESLLSLPLLSTAYTISTRVSWGRKLENSTRKLSRG